MQATHQATVTGDGLGTNLLDTWDVSAVCVTKTFLHSELIVSPEARLKSKSNPGTAVSPPVTLSQRVNWWIIRPAAMLAV